MTQSPENASEQKLSSPGGFDRLAHELRTPLAAIQALADALAQGYLGPLENPRHVSYVASIRETARHALAVVDSMTGRTAEKPGGGSRTSVDLAQVSREVVDGLALLAARNSVRFEAAGLLAPVRCLARETEVRRMLLNLMANCAMHAGAGASVDVRAGSDGAGHVFVEVADNGPGLAAEIVDRLARGEPLGDAEATGVRQRLGLTMTRALAVANGGRLEILSGPAGTRARIVLPAAMSELPPSSVTA